MSYKHVGTAGDLVRFGCSLKVECTACDAARTMSGVEVMQVHGTEARSYAGSIASTGSGSSSCARCLGIAVKQPRADDPPLFLSLACSVPDSEDEHCIPIDAITKDIRPHGRHLPLPATGIAAPVGKFGQAVGNLDEPHRKPLGGGRVEGGYVIRDDFEIGDRFVGPDDRPQALVAGARPRQRFRAAPRRQPPAHRAMADQPARTHIRFGTSIGPGLRLRIGMIEQRPFHLHRERA